MLIADQKNQLRLLYRKQRAQLSKADVQLRSKLINENFLENLLPNIKHEKKTFGLYLPFGNEVESEIIADYFIKHNIIFSYPRITDINAPLEFIISSANQKFISSKIFPKIIEPAIGEKITPDIIVMPLLAFDSSLSRLGMGGGFFDRTIEICKKQKPQFLTIGLAYEFQRAHEILPVEEVDQKLDFIVTEKSIFSRT